MADNMIELIAKLDISGSAAQINGTDIPTLEKKLKAIKIKCDLETGNIAQLQSQLSNASKNLKVAVPKIDMGGSGNEIANQVTHIADSVTSAMGRAKQELADTFGVKMSNVITNTFKNAEGQVTKFTLDVTKLNGEVEKFNYNISKKQDGSNTYYEYSRASSRDTDKGALGLLQAQSKEVDTLTEKLLNLLNLYRREGSSANLLNPDNVKQFDEAINSADRAVEKIKGSTSETFSQFVADAKSAVDACSNLGKELGNVEAQQRKVSEASTKEADALARGLNNLQAKYTDPNAAKPITDATHLTGLQAAYDNAIDKINKLRTANAETFAQLSNDARAARDEYNNLAISFRNAETAATKLRAKPIETIKQEELANLDKFVATVSNSAVPNVENLVQRVETLRADLSQVGDKQGLTDYLNSLSGVVADFKAMETQAKAVKDALKDLDKLSSNTQFAKNANNPSVINQMASIEALRTKFQQLLAELGNAKSPEALQRISESLVQLKPEFDSVMQSSTALSSQLRTDNSAAVAAAKLNTLTNQMEGFAATNRKATTSLQQMRNGMTFADEWNRMMSQLRSGNLDGNAVQRLSEEFRNFKGEASSAGLTVSKFFNDMNSQIRMVLRRWISLYAVVGYIRQMVDEVKALDTAMINLRRVTDETEESYSKFLKSATAQAQTLKTTASSIIEQSYQWAKLGYSMEESLELANASTIYQRVGDVDQQQALSNLVTALKAYRLEAEDTISIVDKLDKLNNEFAVSASGLGQGLERSASAMAMTGNSLEQTLALLTGAGEITQNLENTGNAIKVASLR